MLENVFRYSCWCRVALDVKISVKSAITIKLFFFLSFFFCLSTENVQHPDTCSKEISISGPKKNQQHLLHPSSFYPDKSALRFHLLNCCLIKIAPSCTVLREFMSISGGANPAAILVMSRCKSDIGLFFRIDISGVSSSRRLRMVSGFSLTASLALYSSYADFKNSGIGSVFGQSVPFYFSNGI